MLASNGYLQCRGTEAEERGKLRKSVQSTQVDFAYQPRFESPVNRRHCPASLRYRLIFDNLCDVRHPVLPSNCNQIHPCAKVHHALGDGRRRHADFTQRVLGEQLEFRPVLDDEDIALFAGNVDLAIRRHR